VQAVRANLRRAAALTEALRPHAPEVALSFLLEPNVLTSIAARRLGVPHVASERVDPRHHPVRAPWRWLGERAYARARLVVANSEAVRALLAARHGEERVLRIPNLVEPPPEPAPAPDVLLPPTPFVLAVGRLDPQKGHDRVLEAFARRRAGRGWRLVVLGEGPERAALEARARALGLEGASFPGRSRVPAAALARAGVFALASRYEGQSNALLEALAAGLPVVAFRGPSAAEEVLVDGVSGRLVPDGDVDAFAAALDELTEDGAVRARLADGARRAAAAFAPARVVPAWEAAIERAISPAAAPPPARPAPRG